MKLVVLGLSITSSWGNGHATTYRGLLREFTRRGHQVTFLERDVPWYAAHRDLPNPIFCQTRLYGDLDELMREHGRPVAEADAVIVGSYVREGVAVAGWICETAAGVRAFYDIDTPVTLAKLARRDHEYLAPELIQHFDLYLSFTGGPTLQRLEQEFGSPMARALYCSVDERHYRPCALPARWDLGYLGTYSEDRQPTLERLLLAPARSLAHAGFVVAGPQYPASIDWPENVARIEHLPPPSHPGFYAGQRFTLNVTRADMVAAGWSPSVRLFEAASCGVPIVSDTWPGLSELFEPEAEIFLAETPEDVIRLLCHCSEDRRRQVAAAARARTLQAHTSAVRARELEAHLLAAACRPSRPKRAAGG